MSTGSASTLLFFEHAYLALDTLYHMGLVWANESKMVRKCYNMRM